MLVILGGPPGTGKTTLARNLARALEAVHLCVDSIEGELFLRADHADVGDLGYRISHHLAADNLAVGRNVVADQVNARSESRAAWREVAAGADVPFREIELICSDEEELRRRLAARGNVVEWETVVARTYDQWDSAATIDTAGLSPGNVAALALKILASS